MAVDWNASCRKAYSKIALSLGVTPTDQSLANRDEERSNFSTARAAPPEPDGPPANAQYFRHLQSRTYIPTDGTADQGRRSLRALGPVDVVPLFSWVSARSDLGLNATARSWI